MSAPVYLIDASIYIFRAWFSVPDDLVDDQGRPVNAVIGFFDFVIQLLNEVQANFDVNAAAGEDTSNGVQSRAGGDGPDIVFVFDGVLDQSHRSEIYPPYKKNRDPAPPELKRQFQQCRDVISSMGICEISHHRYEADDIIGTLVKCAHAQGQDAVIVSADKDLTQLVRERDIWWHYAKRERLDYFGIIDRFGVSPLQIADLLALTGDAVDNIPGVPGIGMVTATKLLKHFETLDALLDNLHEVEQIPGLRRAKHIAGAIQEHTETVQLARQLTPIYCDVPLPDEFSSQVGAPDYDQFALLSKTFGFSPRRKSLFASVLDGLRR